jgi:hypothetical protein
VFVGLAGRVVGLQDHEHADGGAAEEHAAWEGLGVGVGDLGGEFEEEELGRLGAVEGLDGERL